MCADQLAQFDNQVLDGLEFCSKAYDLLEQIRNSPDGPSRLRKLARQDKKLVEEILPICKYVQESYRPGRRISIRWLNGSQPFDAEMIQRGAFVNENYHPPQCYIEVTTSVHPNEHLIREVLDKTGVAYGPEGAKRLKNGDAISSVTSHKNRDFIPKDAALLLKELNKKAVKTYPLNTTLIIVCKLHLPYTPDEWDQLMKLVYSQMPENAFREIFITDEHWQHKFSYFPR